MRKLYSLLARLLFIGVLPKMLYRLITSPAYRPGARQKLGFDLPQQKEKTIWIHTVSVGEVLAVPPLIDLLSGHGKKIVLTVTTPSGHRIAVEKLGDKTEIFYFPIDLTGAVARSVKAINPAIFATIDTEIWPNVLWAAKDHGAVTAILNGRISDRSYPRYLRFSLLFRTVLESVDLFLMQSQQDKDRIITIGADPASVTVAGNLKFDRAEEKIDDSKRESLRKALGILPDEKVVLLGSLHAGEEIAIASAAIALKNFGGGRMIIAPRRIDDIGWIEIELAKHNLTPVLQSKFIDNRAIDQSQVVVIDTFGQLASLYSIADVAFVGGSLIPHGGQNPLEPASHGVATIFGPSMENFAEATRALIAAGGAIQVEAGGLESAMVELLSNIDKRKTMGDAARRVVEKNRGAAKLMAKKLLASLDVD